MPNAENMRQLPEAPHGKLFVLSRVRWSQLFITRASSGISNQPITSRQPVCNVMWAMTPPYNIQERTFEFAVQVVLFCRKAAKEHATPRVLARQLLRSATSVGANMEEADGAQTKPDFRTKVTTAKKEAKETVYWLGLLAAHAPYARH